MWLQENSFIRLYRKTNKKSVRYGSLVITQLSHITYCYTRVCSQYTKLDNLLTIFVIGISSTSISPRKYFAAGTKVFFIIVNCEPLILIISPVLICLNYSSCKSYIASHNAIRIIFLLFTLENIVQVLSTQKTAQFIYLNIHCNHFIPVFINITSRYNIFHKSDKRNESNYSYTLNKYLIFLYDDNFALHLNFV